MSTELSHHLQQAAQLPPDLMLLKMENETMMSAAAVRPRDYKKVMEQLRNLIEAYPEFADDAIYCKPVGKVYEVHCHNAECKHKFESSKQPTSETECPRCGTKYNGTPAKRVQKYAEGLSIRAAESIRSLFGYNRLAVTETALPDGRVKITGVFVDFAAATITIDERTVSPYYTAYDGTKTLINEDRFLNVTVKAEKSKLRRDVIVGSIPSELKAGYMDACNKKLEELLTDEKVGEIVKAFERFGVDEKSLEQLIGRPRSMGWTTEDRVRLTKIYSSLKNEEITAAELLNDLEGGQQAAPKPKGKRVREVELPEPVQSKPSGATSYVTSANWREMDLPPGTVELFERAIAANSPERITEIMRDGIQSAGENEYLAAAFQTAADGAKAELKSQKSLV